MLCKHSMLGPALLRRCGLLTAFSCLALTAVAQQPTEPYLDPSLPVTTRANDLVARMTLDEKIAQMQNDAPAIPRLHVAAYNWWNEALHGVARSGYATVFPQAIGLAATWDAGLMRRIGDVVSIEARAKYNQALRENNHDIFYGLTLWSPNINIDRDPRWGRGQETFGEDPFLTGRLGSAYVRGLQGDDPHYLRTAATAKHFAVHSGPESDRHTFDATVSPHDLQDTYLPAFRALVVDARVAGVMCAYNSLDGSPACSSDLLMQQTLRRDWHFTGYTVSDCNAITDIAVGHRFSADMPHAAAAAVKAGTDMSCGNEYAALSQASKLGLVNEAQLNATLHDLFLIRFRLGMFDPPASVPFNRIPVSDNDSSGHASLALKAAEDSIVLLKNVRDALPLSGRALHLAVVGPNAASLASLEGNYNAVPSHPVTPLAALQADLPGRITYAQGSSFVEGYPVPVPETLLTSIAGGRRVTGLRAEYFAGKSFSGKPTLSRIDRNIDFDWNGASPAAGMDAHAFSVRWTGTITPPSTGTLEFGFSLSHCSTCFDAESIRVWLDGKAVYNFDHPATKGRHAPTPRFTMAFKDTRAHALRIEYVHDSPHFGAGLTFEWLPPATALRKQAVAAARSSDVVIAFLGLSPNLEGEEMPVHVEGFSGGDRTSIDLPATQQQLTAELAATGKPVILVLMNGGAIALGDAALQASAILEAWYPGEAGGAAIANTLLGRSNPSAKLPVTFYASTSQLPPFGSYAMQQRTYRYFTGQPLYRFGDGLSFTHFTFADLHPADTSLQAGASLPFDINVSNTGPRAGDAVIEAYLMPVSEEAATAAPISLVGFWKIHLDARETRAQHLRIDPRQLSVVAPDGQRRIVKGRYRLVVGGSQPGGSSETLSAEFSITGNLDLPR
ncbi:beta-glucosidase [Bryocella elongata]|uniref:Beta-glucosidase n=1 Tax=Bryocella elongata TaxID=863522 RepID=A0A1H6CGM7_9BACT|nr:glycoside hydrolase family 3 C-terminal domain-containing protein [Bryocella elongata]SEG72169.1 beta-glucosidase [Bryocella elongata]